MSICVTGGSSGLGRAIAERFAPGGNHVFVNYHANDAAAAETAASIESLGGIPHLIKADVGTPEGCQELMREVGKHVDRLDQLVHAAAKAATGATLTIDPQELTEAITLNGTALVYLVQAALPLLQRGSSVYYISSRGSRIVIPNYVALGTAKALGEHIMRYLAVELAPRGIRANTVSPGAVDTAAFRAMFPDNWQQRLEAAAKANPSGRGVKVEDAADVVWLLSQPGFEMVQGQIIGVDGGVSL
jgi:enoyl-[acyl-carrier protein] reductase III